MPISSKNNFSISPQLANPIKENNRPARNGTTRSTVLVALAILAVIGAIVAGITLTTIGAITVNPVFLNIGICLLVGGILVLVKAGITAARKSC